MLLINVKSVPRNAYFIMLRVKISKIDIFILNLIFFQLP